MHPVGRVCSRLAEESRLIDRRVLVLSQMVTASRSIPPVPRPSSVSVATQTVETLLSSRVPEIPEIDNESAGDEYGPVSLSGAP